MRALFPASRLAARGRVAVGLAALAGLLAPAPRSVSAERAGLSLERVVRDGYLGPLLAGLRWRPGRATLTYVRGDRVVLQDAASGEERALVSLSALEKGRGSAAPGKGAAGIGRAGTPAFLWSETGDALFVPRRDRLHRVDGETGEAETVLEDAAGVSDVRPSPDGTRVAFARDFDLWVATRGEHGAWTTRRLTSDGSDDRRNAGLDWVYPEELGCETGIWWSPDSRRIAFLRLDETGVERATLPDVLGQHAQPHRQPYPRPGGTNPRASVGVVSADGGDPVPLRLGDGVEYVPWAAWIDARRVLVATMDRPQKRVSLRTCSADDGALLGVVADESETTWVEPPEPPLLLANPPALVWRRPRDGWWAAVLVPLERGAGPEKTLTKPGRDVDRLVAVDEAKDLLYYEGASDAPGSRVLRRVPLAGGEDVVLGPASGWHRARPDDACAWFLDEHSSGARAPRQTLRRADGAEVRTLADAETEDLRALSLPSPVLGEILRPDGVSLRTSYRRPPSASPEAKVPAIVFVYGGPGARSVRDAWTGLFHALLVEDGFAVLEVDNRGSAGCGRDFETHVCRRLGEAELEDQILGAEHLRSLPEIDGERLGVWGWSYGGTMTLLAMTAGERSPFRAGVAVAPVTDWHLYDSVYTERYLGLPHENSGGYTLGSPLRRAADLQGALLLCHGLSDDNVHFRHSALFVDALLRAGLPFEWMPYPGRGHGIEGDASRLDLFRRVRAHFHRHLLGGAPANGTDR